MDLEIAMADQRHCYGCTLHCLSVDTCPISVAIFYLNSIHPKEMQKYVIHRIHYLPKHVDKIERNVFTEVTDLLMGGKTNQ